MMHDHEDDVDGGHATLHNLVAQVKAQLQWLRFPTKTASDAAPVHRFASKTWMLRLLLHLPRANPDAPATTTTNSLENPDALGHANAEAVGTNEATTRCGAAIEVRRRQRRGGWEHRRHNTKARWRRQRRGGWEQRRNNTMRRGVSRVSNLV